MPQLSLTRRHRASRVQQRRLGSTTLSVSALGLGCNNFGIRLALAATRAVVHKAFDLGVTMFDTADIYGERGGSEPASRASLAHTVNLDVRTAPRMRHAFALPRGGDRFPHGVSTGERNEQGRRAVALRSH